MGKDYKDEFKEQLSQVVLHSLAQGEQIEFDIDEFNYTYDKSLVDDYIKTHNEAGITKNDFTIDKGYLKGALRYTSNDDLKHTVLTQLEELFNRRYNVILSADFHYVSKDDPYIDAVRESDFHRFRSSEVIQGLIRDLLKAVDEEVLMLYEDSHGSGSARQYIHTIYGDEGDGLVNVLEQLILF